MIGDPTPATREQGEGLLDSLAASWAQAIIEIHRMARVERREPTWANSTGTALCSPYHLLSLLNRGALMNTRLTPVFTLLTVAALATSASCFAAEKFTFLTNWYARAEHGGFYQPVPPGCINTPVSMSKLKWAARRSTSCS